MSLCFFCLWGEVLHHRLGKVGYGCGQGGCLVGIVGLGVDADDGLGVRFAQVYPAVGKVDFHAVDVGNLLVGIAGLDSGEYGVDVGAGLEHELHLHNLVGRVCGAELAHGLARFCKQGQEECHAHERVAAIVQLGVYDAAVALAAYYGPGFLHLGGDVYFAYGGSVILSATGDGHVAQGAARAEVAHGVARSMLQHVVGNRHEGVFFAEHLAVLVDNGEAVNVGVDHEGHVGHAAGHQVGNAGQVLGDRFGRVGKVAGGRAVEFYYLFNAEGLEQLGDDDAANRVYGVDSHGEVCVANGLGCRRAARPVRRRCGGGYRWC